MKIINLKENLFLYKNNYLYLKKNFFCKIKIPKIIYIYINNKNLYIKSFFNINVEQTIFKIINNLIIGINYLWKININFSGIGYKIYIEKNKLILNLGFTKSKYLIIPKYIFVEIKKDKIELKSVYKDKLGIFIFKILKSKKFDPYKKKGIFLENKIILKKSSKKKQ